MSNPAKRIVHPTKTPTLTATAVNTVFGTATRLPLMIPNTDTLTPVPVTASVTPTRTPIPHVIKTEDDKLNDLMLSVMLVGFMAVVGLLLVGIFIRGDAE